MGSNWEKAFRDKLSVKTSRSLDKNILAEIKERNAKENYYFIPTLVAACLVVFLVSLDSSYEYDLTDQELSVYLETEELSENDEILSELDIDELSDEDWDILLGDDNEAS